MIIGNLIVYLILLVLSIILWFVLIICNNEIDLGDVFSLMVILIMPCMYLVVMVLAVIALLVMTSDFFENLSVQTKSFLEKINKKIFKK